MPFEEPGTQIGPYKLREQIGEGGFGVVYVAEQTQPVRRKVALKIIKPGMDTKDVIARFEAERQALALMDHPNIAKVLDAGTTGEPRGDSPWSQASNHLRGLTPPGSPGRPYFVMELVKGVAITEFCDEQKLDTRERLQLFINVCRAVQHAHQKGIIHRDLKPSNVMVTLHDDKPVVKVIDFGVSKALSQQLTENSIYTAYGQMVGTPLYMSPEQARLSGLDVDTRSDVYSLGVLLYELLTGTTPFDKETLKNAGFDELRRIIREDEPPRPSARISTLNAEALSTVCDKRKIDPRKLGQCYRGELDWIVMKALEKDRNRRYESPNAFAADVERYLNDDPVAARPASLLYRLRKITRRNRGVLATVFLVGLSLVIGATAAVMQAIRATAAERLSAERLVNETAARKNATRERDDAKIARLRAVSAQKKADQNREIADRRRYVSDIRLALSQWQRGSFDSALDILKAHIPGKSTKDRRDWEWHYLWSLIHQTAQTISGKQKFCTSHSYRQQNVGWAPDGKRIAAVTASGGIQIWNVKSGRKVLSIHRKGVPACEVRGPGIRWRPDGKCLASFRPDGAISVWDATTGRERLRLEPQTLKKYFSLWLQMGDYCWNSDGTKNAVVGGRRSVLIWDQKTQQVSFLRRPDAPKSSKAPASREYVAWSPDGEMIAMSNLSIFGAESVSIWDVATKQLTNRLRWSDPAGSPSTFAFSPNSARLAVTFLNGGVGVWNPRTGQSVLSFSVEKQNRNGILQLHWSKSGDKIYVNDGGRFDVRDAQTGLRIQTVRAWGAFFSWNPDGRRVATTVGGKIRIHDIRDPQEYRALKGHFEWVPDLAWGPKSRRLVSVSFYNGFVRVWDVKTGREVLSHQFPLSLKHDRHRVVEGRRQVVMPSFKSRRPTDVSLSADERYLSVHSEQWTLFRGTLEELEAKRRSLIYPDRIGEIDKGIYCLYRPLLTVLDLQTGNTALEVPHAVASAFHPTLPRLSVIRRVSSADAAMSTYQLEFQEIAAKSRMPTKAIRYSAKKRNFQHRNRIRPTKLVWSPSGKHVVIHADSTGVFVVAAKSRELVFRTGKTVHKGLRPTFEWPLLSVWNHDGTRLAYTVRGVKDASATVDGKGRKRSQRVTLVEIFDPTRRETVVTEEFSSVSGLKWRRRKPQSSLLVVSNDNRGRFNGLWDLNAVNGRRERTPTPVIRRTPITVRGLDDRFVALGHAHTRYLYRNHLFSRQPSDRLIELPGCIDPSRLTCSPDGKHIAFTKGNDGTIGVWSAQTRSSSWHASRTRREGTGQRVASLFRYAESIRALGNNSQSLSALRELERALQQLVDQMPNYYLDRREVLVTRLRIARLLEAIGKYQESDAVYRKALDECEDVKAEFPILGQLKGHRYLIARLLNASAWAMATRSAKRFRNAATALTRAKRAVALRPEIGSHWNTLGVAHFRNGHWDAAINALQKPIALSKAEDSFDCFFLAMSCWKRGEKRMARTWYDKAIDWMNKHAAQNRELVRFRAEAERLMGIQRPAKNRSPATAPKPRRATPALKPATAD